jgi:hypothetical protein
LRQSILATGDSDKLDSFPSHGVDPHIPKKTSTPASRFPREIRAVYCSNFDVGRPSFRRDVGRSTLPTAARRPDPNSWTSETAFRHLTCNPAPLFSRGVHSASGIQIDVGGSIFWWFFQGCSGQCFRGCPGQCFQGVLAASRRDHGENTWTNVDDKALAGARIAQRARPTGMRGERANLNFDVPVLNDHAQVFSVVARRSFLPMRGFGISGASLACKPIDRRQFSAAAGSSRMQGVRIACWCKTLITKTFCRTSLQRIPCCARRRRAEHRVKQPSGRPLGAEPAFFGDRSIAIGGTEMNSVVWALFRRAPRENASRSRFIA